MAARYDFNDANLQNLNRLARGSARLRARSRLSIPRRYGPRASRTTAAGLRAWPNRKWPAAAVSTTGSIAPNARNCSSRLSRIASPDPGEKVRIRRDSKWNVPEPELALVISPAGKITGYTIGNDMSSRDIEGENPLYLPQAKVYDRSCALGPAILVSDEPMPASTFHRHRNSPRRRPRSFPTPPRSPP